MYGDFSRLLEDVERHYGAVLFQQARPILDADINELSNQILRYLHRLVIDVIGHAGTSIEGDGFKISLDEDGLHIGGGFYYVEGHRCEYREGEEARLRIDSGASKSTGAHRICSNVNFDTGDAHPVPPYVVFLRVWERTVTACQDETLREPALAARIGDTIVRSQVVWEVLAANTVPSHQSLPDDVEDIVREWDEVSRRQRHDRRRGFLRAQVEPHNLPQLRNQLLRVEVLRGGRAKDLRLGWSRDNASTLFGFVAAERVQRGQVFKPSDGNRVRLRQASRGRSGPLENGQWLQYVDDLALRPGDRRGGFHRVVAVSTDDESRSIYDVQLDPPLDEELSTTLDPILRRWDGALEDGEGLEDLHWSDDPEPLSSEIVLDGVTVELRESDDGQFHAGDYWLIPVRSYAGLPQWPADEQGSPRFLSPRAFRYHDTPLAWVTSRSEVIDLRRTFYGSSIWELEKPTDVRTMIREVVHEELENWRLMEKSEPPVSPRDFPGRRKR